jgi:hypothetical protein
VQISKLCSLNHRENAALVLEHENWVSPDCRTNTNTWGPFLTSPLVPRGEICPLGGMFTPPSRDEHSLLFRRMDGQTDYFTPWGSIHPHPGDKIHPWWTNPPLASKFAPRGEVTNGPQRPVFKRIFAATEKIVPSYRRHLPSSVCALGVHWREFLPSPPLKSCPRFDFMNPFGLKFADKA